MQGIEGASHEAPSSRFGRMTHRVVVTVVLALGFGGVADVGLAVNGVESQGSSALDAQAGLPNAGDSPVLAPRAANDRSRGVPGTVPGAGDERRDASFALQRSRQLRASDRELPFTGRVAILVLSGGLVLASAGFLLRRS